MPSKKSPEIDYDGNEVCNILKNLQIQKKLLKTVFSSHLV